ncbi:hypothetical protein NEOLEDRAFT_1129697 [Neolentinus lepideus HHB14362 ss-1]|uniref:Uncharacterized protein n=1 Tax=Neolentinus lepideus HHB14362 ss-1 TaxID=1314782 RepID=A0A165UKK8_9AGAM|nr:hypothetical protein NEOLEDRAFT_1129697 [Neolentinus lepideus HHB14362 ss-1]
MNLIIRPSKAKLWNPKHRIHLMSCNGLRLYTCIFSHHQQRRSLSTAKAVASKHKQVDTAAKVTTAAESHRGQTLQVRTLDQRRLSAEDFVALGGHKAKSIVFPTAAEQPRRPGALLYLRQNMEYIDFPSDAQGFLYWHVEPDAPALASQVRFRITPSSDPATFPDGRDLHLPNGRVWNMNIFEIARNSTLSGFRAHLLAEKLVTRELLDVALAVSVHDRTEKIVHPFSDSVFIWKFGQTFRADLGSRTATIWVLGRSGGKRLCITFFRYRAGLVEGPGQNQYTGSALLQFERSTLAEHKGTRTVVMRMVKILDMEKSENLVDIGSMSVPEEGSLMMKRGTHGAWSTWSVNVDKPRSRIQTTLSDVLSILFDNEEY